MLENAVVAEFGRKQPRKSAVFHLMEELCDEQGRFSVANLDAAVQTFYDIQAPAESRLHAERVLTWFTVHPNAWSLVDQILETSQSEYTKFLAVRVLSHLVSEKWKHLPVDQRIAIRNYIVNIIIAYSSTPDSLQVGRSYLTKLNTTLVEIIKKDWPEDWPDFVQEITTASSRNPSLCENIMAILGILSEDVFESSEEELPAWKARKLGKSIISQFGPIIDTILEILSKADTPSLVETTLKTLQHFIKWLPKDVIYSPSLVEALGMRMVSGPGLPVQCAALRCFRDCLGAPATTSEKNEIDTIKLQMFNYVVQSIHRILPSDQDLQTLYENANEDVQDLLINYTSFLLTYFVWKHELSSVPVDAINDLLRLSSIQDSEIWSICLDSFTAIIRALRRKKHQGSIAYNQTQVENIHLLCRILPLIVRRMPYPDEVLVVEDGNPKFINSGSTSDEYNSTRKLLKEFALLDISTIENALRDSLNQPSQEWSAERAATFSRVCWVVGSIQESLAEEMEDRLIPALFSEATTQLSELSAVSSLMYLASTFTKWLSRHTDIMNIIVQTVLEYTHFQDRDVQDMAVTTLVKVCEHCGDILNGQLNGVDYVQVLLNNMSALVKHLHPTLVPKAYQSLGFLAIRTAQPAAALVKLMEDPNEKLLSVVAKVQQQPHDTFTLAEALYLIQINISVCIAVDKPFANQMQYVQESLVKIYQVTGATTSFDMSLSENVKCAIKELLRAYMKTDHPGAVQETVHLFGELLSSPPQEEDISDLVADTVSNMHTMAGFRQPFMEMVYHQAFERIYAQICHNFEDYYSKRPGFYAMVRALVTFAFDDLLRFPADNFLLIVKSILWGMQHPGHDISNNALETCSVLLQRIGELEDEDQQNDLYTVVYMTILQAVIRLINDRDRRTQFELQSELLARLLDLVQQGYIYTRLFPGSDFESNAAYVQEFIRAELCNIYPDLPSDQIDLVAHGMLEYSDDVDRFRKDLVDFMADFRSTDEFAKPVSFDD